MPVKNDKGWWLDGSGAYVPPRYVGKIEKMRDRIVSKHVAKALKLSAQVEKWKAEIYADLDKYFAVEEELYGISSRNPGQNKIFSDFAQKNRIDMHASRVLDFDDRIWIVQEKLFEYIEQELESVDNKKRAEGLRHFIEKAYKPSKNGKLDKNQILSLKGLREKIDHPLIREAMDILDECVHELDRRINIKFAARDKKGKWQTVNLDFSRVSGVRKGRY